MFRRFSPGGDGGGGTGSGDAAAQAAAKAVADKKLADDTAAAAARAASDKAAADKKIADDLAAAEAAKGKDGKGGAGPGDGVPEKYDLKLSDNSKLTEKDVTELAAFAKENGLTQKQAEGLLKNRETALSAQEKAQTDIIGEQVKQWDDVVRADKTMGATYEDTVKVATGAFNQAFDEKSEIRTFLKTSGLGSHPDVVKFFYKLGVEWGEDKHKQGSGAGGKKEKTLAQKMYPNQPSVAAQ